MGCLRNFRAWGEKCALNHDYTMVHTSHCEGALVREQGVSFHDRMRQTLAKRKWKKAKRTLSLKINPPYTMVHTNILNHCFKIIIN